MGAISEESEKKLFPEKGMASGVASHRRLRSIRKGPVDVATTQSGCYVLLKSLISKGKKREDSRWKFLFVLKLINSSVPRDHT